MKTMLTTAMIIAAVFLTGCETTGQHYSRPLTPAERLYQDQMILELSRDLMRQGMGDPIWHIRTY